MQITKLTIIAAAVLLGGCAKTYKCECKTLDHNSGVVTSSVHTVNGTKKEAELKCNGGDEYSTSYSRDCVAQ